MESGVIGFSATRRVEFRDTDAAGLAHFSAFFVWMESVEHEFWRHLGVPLVMPLSAEPQADQTAAVAEGESALIDPGGPRPVVAGGGIISWPRVAAACEYSGAVRFGDVLTVGLRVDRVGRTSVRFDFRFRCGTAEVAHGGMTAVRCVLQPGRPPEPVPVPDALRRLLEGFRAVE
jgi:4-hydroxybenzoyl-CoA thioesterase/acyl-CoA thioester hydrolase